MVVTKGHDHNFSVLRMRNMWYHGIITWYATDVRALPSFVAGGKGPLPSPLDLLSIF